MKMDDRCYLLENVYLRPRECRIWLS